MSLSSIIKRLTHKGKTEQTILEKELEAAYKDNLTGLPGRSYIERLSMKPLPADIKGGLFLEIDDFTNINQKYGSTERDKILRQQAQILSGLINNKSNAFRYDDNQFLLLLNNSDGTAEDMTNKLRKKLGEYYNRRIGNAEKGFIISTLNLEEGTMKEEISKSRKSIKESILERYRRKGAEKQKPIAILERREELALYIRYRLGQTTISSKEEIEMLFKDIDHKQKSRLEKCSKAIQESGLDIAVFMSYDEVSELMKWNNNLDTMIIYKFKEGKQYVSSFIEKANMINPDMTYIVPFGNPEDMETLVMMDQIREKEHKNVIFSENQDLQTILRTIKDYDLPKWARSRCPIASL